MFLNQEYVRSRGFYPGLNRLPRRSDGRAPSEGSLNKLLVSLLADGGERLSELHEVCSADVADEGALADELSDDVIPRNESGACGDEDVADGPLGISGKP
eukprot:3172107-Pyramimonas_sp.AAC.1